MKRGIFVVAEGGEGSGKDSNLEVLKKELPENSTFFYREPGGSELGEAIRSLLMSPLGKEANSDTHFGLFIAQRADNLRRIEPMLAAGMNVIANRFDLSTFAYQVRGDERSELYQLFHHVRNVYNRITSPDYYVYLDVDPKVGLARARARGDGNHWDEKNLAFHTRVRDGALEFLSGLQCIGLSQGELPYRIIDANRPLEVVRKEFVSTMKNLLGV